MTKEEKQLLLKDLSARLPYGTICRCRTTEDSTWWNTDHRIFGIIGNKFDVGSDILDAEQIKPYLRPMSSMTEEERRHCLKFGTVGMDENDKVFDVYPYGMKRNMAIVDFLNSIHIDYHGLIPMGLALEAKEGMYEKK